MAIPVKYRSIVVTATKAAGAAGIPGAFLGPVDVAAMAGIWGVMIYAIAEKSDHGAVLNKNTAVTLATSIAEGLALYVGGSKVASYLLHLIPGVGTVGAVGVNVFMNALYTYRLGSHVAKMFERTTLSTEDLLGSAKIIATALVGLPSMSDAHAVVSIIGGGDGA